MTAPRIFHYDPLTGAYLGFGYADPSPLEPGTWLLPAHCTETVPPTPGPGQIAVWANDSWSLVAAGQPEPPPLPPLDRAKATKLNALEAKRYAVETGGMMVGGVPLRTDRQTASIITAAYVSAKDDPDFQVANWKVGTGVFITLDAPTIIAIATALRAHVQAAFDREATLSGEILAAATHEAVDAIDINAGW